MIGFSNQKTLVVNTAFFFLSLGWPKISFCLEKPIKIKSTIFKIGIYADRKLTYIFSVDISCQRMILVHEIFISLSWIQFRRNFKTVCLAHYITLSQTLPKFLRLISFSQHIFKIGPFLSSDLPVQPVSSVLEFYCAKQCRGTS